MQIKFNRIYIIESLQTGEKTTGTDLHNDLLRWMNIKHPDFESILKNPITKDDFFSVCDEILDKCEKDGISPIIHFEIHGSEDQTGLILTSGELMTWEELSNKNRVGGKH